MKYISVDIETTGIDPEVDQVLEIGAIIEDTCNLLSFDKIPKFKCIVEHNKYTGNAFAINLNQRIFEILAKIPDGRKDMVAHCQYKVDHNILTPQQAVNEFTKFLRNNNIQSGYSAAGKNYAGFDNLFLKKFENWPKAHQRVIDPGVLFVDFRKDWITPNLETCKQRAGLSNTKVSHDALEDAWDVIQVLRAKY